MHRNSIWQKANFTVATDGTRKKRGTTKQEMLRGDLVLLCGNRGIGFNRNRTARYTWNLGVPVGSVSFTEGRGFNSRIRHRAFRGCFGLQMTSGATYFFRFEIYDSNYICYFTWNIAMIQKKGGTRGGNRTQDLLCNRRSPLALPNSRTGTTVMKEVPSPAHQHLEEGKQMRTTNTSTTLAWFSSWPPPIYHSPQYNMRLTKGTITGQATFNLNANPIC